jgi:CxxC-x17-CxxC domain-containing protein
MALTSPREISCSSCGSDFTFSTEEQEFYESKGFQDPKKCKPCSAAAKQSRGGSGGRGDFGRPRRQLYDAVCGQCGIQTQVPFMPVSGKPVYCRDCYQQTASYY